MSDKSVRAGFLLFSALPFSFPIKKVNIHPGLVVVTYCSCFGVLSTARPLFRYVFFFFFLKQSGGEFQDWQHINNHVWTDGTDFVQIYCYRLILTEMLSMTNPHLSCEGSMLLPQVNIL